MNDRTMNEVLVQQRSLCDLNSSGAVLFASSTMAALPSLDIFYATIRPITSQRTLMCSSKIKPFTSNLPNSNLEVKLFGKVAKLFGMRPWTRARLIG
jgi:hypothetical protein